MLYKKTKELTKEAFQNPGSEYRATPFWAWNCKMTEDEIDNTLTSIKDMGMGGGHVHCRTGMDNPYMSEEFLNLVKYTNDKCKEMDLITYLYDEDRWPSGAAGGIVTKEHQYRARFLLFTPEEKEEREFIIGEPTPEEKADKRPERKLIGKYEVKIENGYMTDYAMIDREAPAKEGYAEWFAYLEVSGDDPWYNNEAYVNTLDGAAMNRFIEETHDKYYEVLGDEFGKTIHSIFTDEPQFSRKTCLNFADDKMDIRIPFTDDLEETFKAAYGHGLMAQLPELFWEIGEDKVSRIRYEYHDHIAERFAVAFADNIGNWCKAHNIALTGHMMEEPTLHSQCAALGEAMRSYRSFDIPGIDMLCDGREFTTAKQAQSAVHQYGYEGMLSELYGVTNWDFDFRGHKLQGDWQAALGVTIRVPHLTWTSMAGEAKRDYPAAIGYQSPWYKEYPLIENHFARVNSAMTRGIPHVRLGVIHPIESYWLYWGPKEQTAGIRAEMDENFQKLTNWLLYGTIDFNFISESLLPEQNKGQEEVNTLKVGNMNYDVILVPNCMTLRSSTLEILEKFKARGGRIIFTGQTPVYVDAYASKRGQALAAQCENVGFSKNQLLKALKEVRDVEIKDADGSAATNLFYQMRKEGDFRWFFLAHVNRAVFEGAKNNMNQDLPVKEHLKIIINGEWSPVLYDTMTGDISEISCTYQNGKTVIVRDMYNHDSLLLKLNPGRQEEKAAAAEDTKQAAVLNIPEKAEVTFSEPNVSILDLAEYRFDDGDWQAEEEVLRIDNEFRKELGYALRRSAWAQPWTADKNEPYLHTLSLRYTITSEVDLEGTKLALENDETTRIFLDDAAVENKADGWYTDHCLRTVALPVITKGIHTLTLEIPFNSRVNIECMFLLGDFTVEVLGTKQILKAPAKTLAYADLTRQGYPFYGGNVTYKIPFVSNGGDVTVQTTMFRAPAVKAAVDGKEIGYMALAPYAVTAKELEAGAHTMEVTVFGSRINTFGTVHNCNQAEKWFGPNAWRSTGAQWAYEYQLKPTGLMKAPIITEK